MFKGLKKSKMTILTERSSFSWQDQAQHTMTFISLRSTSGCVFEPVTSIQIGLNPSPDVFHVGRGLQAVTFNV